MNKIWIIKSCTGHCNQGRNMCMYRCPEKVIKPYKILTLVLASVILAVVITALI